MQVWITGIRLAEGSQHEHITYLRWEEVNKPDNSGVGTKQQMVTWLLRPENQAFVKDGQGYVEVLVADATPMYVRTRADSRWTDNLLALPRV